MRSSHGSAARRSPAPRRVHRRCGCDRAVGAAWRVPVTPFGAREALWIGESLRVSTAHTRRTSVPSLLRLDVAVALNVPDDVGLVATLRSAGSMSPKYPRLIVAAQNPNSDESRLGSRVYTRLKALARQSDHAERCLITADAGLQLPGRERLRSRAG